MFGRRKTHKDVPVAGATFCSKFIYDIVQINKSHPKLYPLDSLIALPSAENHRSPITAIGMKLDACRFLAYRKKLATSLMRDSAVPRPHSFVHMILIDWQASTTFRAYLPLRDAPQVAIRPALPKG
jgi:hypothetical protein